MKNHRVAEWLAAIAIVLVLAIVPLWLRWQGSRAAENRYPHGTRIFNITGIGSQGRWTLEEVTGYNYWWKSFPKAEIRADVGEFVVLRFQSADVTHAFYAPTLGVGPVTIEPGHVEVATFRASTSGVHYYYCTSTCGECHYFMRGMIVVGSIDAIDTVFATTIETCPHHLPIPADASLAERGQYLFQTLGCMACHGEAGRGGIVNPNYVKSTVPQLNRLSSTLSLGDEEEAAMLAKLIEAQATPEEMLHLGTGIDRQDIVVAKYLTVRDVIRKGRVPARSDTLSFVPPLAMPSWEDKLSERDIDAILSYLLQHQMWEEAE